MPKIPKTIGVALAGGRSSRMGGGDKPLTELGGETILARVVRTLAPQCEEVIISANGDPDRFAAFGLPVVADDMADYPGPLAGVLSALDWAAGHRPDVEWVVSVAADSPFLPVDLVLRLHQARAEADTALACTQSGDNTYPVNALWKVSLREDLRQNLERGLRKVSEWTARHGIVHAVWPKDPVDPFFNANTPQDLETAKSLLVQAS